MNEFQGIERPDWITIKQWNNFWANVALTEHGYVWIGGKNRNYGMFRIGKKKYYVHRLIFEWATGVVPAVIDHICSVQHCVTLDHLEDVSTIAENNRRTALRGRNVQQKKTHCPQGHPYDADNTYWYGNSRQCNTCRSWANVGR